MLARYLLADWIGILTIIRLSNPHNMKPESLSVFRISSHVPSLSCTLYMRRSFGGLKSKLYLLATETRDMEIGKPKGRITKNLGVP